MLKLQLLRGFMLLAVSISLIASFRKMKKLTKDSSLIVAALKESSQLVSFVLFQNNLNVLKMLFWTHPTYPAPLPIENVWWNEFMVDCL